MNVDHIEDELRAHCLGFEGATEDAPWEDHFGWKIGGKLFAISSKGSRHVTIKSTPDKQSALIQMDGIEKAAYVGRFGWVTIEILDESRLDLAKSLIEESHALVAPKSKLKKAP